MSETTFYPSLLIVWLTLAVVTFLALLRINAPYGRHRRTGWGPELPARTGWFVMELPAVLVMVALFLASDRRQLIVPLVLLGLWLTHYLNRALVYPLRLGAASRPMPLAIVAMAFVFNLINGYLNGRWLFALGPERPTAWLGSPAFLLGTALFLGGMVINHSADTQLRRLRKQSDGYTVPKGGLYRWISCPNYFGEILEWIGWAVATWSLAGLSFALWTVANLLPRALAHHRWYRRQFADYPSQRRAVIPFLL